jgi:hypothetical protein
MSHSHLDQPSILINIALTIDVIAGIRCDRQLVDGRHLRKLCKRGQQVYLVGLNGSINAARLTNSARKTRAIN